MACIRERRNRLVIDFYDQHGKRRWKTLKEGATKKEAKDTLRGIENAIKENSYIPRSEVPGFSEMAELWLKNKKAGLIGKRVRASTFRHYVGHVETHLKPYFGKIKINALNYDSIEEFIRYCQGKQICTATVKQIRITLGAIIDYAFKKKYISNNPVRGFKLTDDSSEIIDPEEGEELKKINFLTPVQIQALLSETSELKYQTLFLIAVTTGMRQGELLGLKWDDIDWKKKQIQVKRTFNHNRFYPPKTPHAKRRIDIGPMAINLLTHWQEHCPENRLKLVFPNGAGNPMDATSMVRRQFVPALESAELPRIRFHDLRHTYASIQLNILKAPPKYVQTQMGHSSIKITYDIYGHWMEDSLPEAAVKLEREVLGESMVANRLQLENTMPANAVQV